jgi:hypothetical protein
MSTYSASRRVNRLDHPLNERLGGYCQGLVARVPRVTDYDPKNLDTVRFPPVVNGWGTKYHIPDIALPLLAEEEGPPT